MTHGDLLGFSDSPDKPAPVRMYELLYSSLASQLLIVVAELGVADALGDEQLHIDELASRTGTDPNALYRALRALASIGVFTEVQPRTFALTPLAATLRTGTNGSMRDLARYVGLPARQRAFNSLIYSLRTGQPAFDHVHGTDWWTYFAAHPELATLFNNAMGSMNRMVSSATLEAHDLSGVHRLVDVGAGKGHLVATLLRRYPEMLTLLKGHVRTEAEFAALFENAGLRLKEVKATHAATSVIVAVPA